MGRIALNADMGESFGMYRMGDDAALLRVVDSANVACGFHAGDPMVMTRTVALAREAGVSIGAHPSYPDLQGFGRRAMALTPAELTAVMTYQMAALDGMARANGHRMTHVKPHGALNNLACEDPDVAAVIALAVKAFDPGLILLAPALSELARAGAKSGLSTALEVFADRAYTERGTLVPRREAGAMIEGADASCDHVLKMLEAGGLVTRGGTVLPTPIHSICVHGDGPGALAAARAVRDGLIAQGISPTPLSDLF